MKHKHKRSLSRLVAVEVLFACDLRSKTPDEMFDCDGICTLKYDIDQYAENLIRGTFSNKDRFDKLLGEISHAWSINRITPVDLNIMRVAMYEMYEVDDVPISVAIDEAVELAKDFGCEEDSYKFINGMLGAIANKHENELSC